MKICLACDKEIEDGDFCDGCKTFLSWKHKSDLNKELRLFRKNKKFVRKWRSGKKEVEE